MAMMCVFSPIDMALSVKVRPVEIACLLVQYADIDTPGALERRIMHTRDGLVLGMKVFLTETYI